MNEATRVRAPSTPHSALAIHRPDGHGFVSAAISPQFITMRTKTHTQKIIAFWAAMLMSSIPALAQSSASGRINVLVVGLRNNNGKVSCALFKSADGFPDQVDKALQQTFVEIQNQHAICEFNKVSPGEYAVSAYHDENSNGTMDRNVIGIPKEGGGAADLGIPKEGVGESNDAIGHFGPPKFDDARFSYGGGAHELTIRLRYLMAPQ